MSKIIVTVYHAKDYIVNESERLFNSLSVFNQAKFTKAAVVVIDANKIDITGILETAFAACANPTFNGEKFGANVIELNLERYSKGGDVLVVDNDVWLAKSIGWKLVGKINLSIDESVVE